MAEQRPIRGRCLCGQVTLEVAQFNRGVVACHCTQCRRQTGHFVAAARADNDHLRVEGAEHVNWFRASDEAERGFCRHCGSLLLWRRLDSTTTSIMAGCLEGATGLNIECHIFVGDKGDYYDINDDAPQRW